MRGSRVMAVKYTLHLNSCSRFRAFTFLRVFYVLELPFDTFFRFEMLKLTYRGTRDLVSRVSKP